MTSRIHIIGGPGSGKTYLAEKLSERLGIPRHDLDEFFWDNSAGTYGSRNTPEVRDRLLRTALKEPRWIIEGVYHQWVQESFLAADVIVVLQAPASVRNRRILKRFFRRKFGREPSKRESLKDLFALLRYNREFDRDNLPRILKMVAQHEPKLYKCASADEAMDVVPM